MYIAPGVSDEEYKKLNLDDNDSPDWERAVEIFKLRISSRYLEPVDLLVEDDNKRCAIDRRYGFSILAIDCLIIETLQSFREGLTDTTSRSEKMFINFLAQREHFRKHFSEKDAKRFYKNIRCGILHQAEIMGDTLLWSVGMVKGKKSDGTPYINRTKIHELIKKEVDLYCDELKNKENIDIRNNFRKKMDFIARRQ